MKAVCFDPGTNDFAIRNLPVPRLEPEDVLIRVHACGLNPVDGKIVNWKQYAAGMSSSWVPGLDVSGEIVQTGEAVTGWKPGDRVLYHGNMFRPHGGLAEFAVHKAATLIRHPELGPAEAASLPCAGWTAWRAMTAKLKAQGGAGIFIAGGSSAVGAFAVQIARLLQMGPIIASCSAANIEYVTRLGADHVLDYRTAGDSAPSLPAQIAALTESRMVRYALDAVGGENAAICSDVLSFEGEMVEIVDVVNPGHYTGAFDRGLSYHQFNLGAAHRHGSMAETRLAADGRAFTEHVARGEIRLLPVTRISLEEAVPALRGILGPKQPGKTVVTLADHPGAAE